MAPSSAEPLRSFRNADRPRRQRIVEAVQRGEALTDPADARLAVALGESFLRQHRYGLALIPVAMLVYGVLGVSGNRSAGLVAGSSVLLGVFLFSVMFPINRIKGRKIQRAIAANREVSGE